MKKIVICGGHLTPALALIEELESRKDLEIVFFGRKKTTAKSQNLSLEHETAKKHQIKFYNLTAGKLQRKFTRYTLLWLIKIPLGFAQSFIYLLLERPNLAVSFGGYLSTPVVFCAWLLGIGSITHEQASVPGLATRINSLFVKKIFLSWPQTQKYFDGDKTIVIGNLMRQSLAKGQKVDTKIANFLKKPQKLILITGGNLGSHFLNQLITKEQVDLKNYLVVHQLGTTNFGGDHQKAQSIKSPNYLAVPYLEGANHGAILERADLVICRAGANTIWELAAFAKPAIIVPLSVSSGNEQIKNAQILKDAGSALVLRQEELKGEKLISSISKIFQNYPQYKNKAVAFQKTLPTGASRKLAGYILETLRYT